MLVILAVTDARFEHPALAPLAIGLTLAAIHFVAIPATGTSVNPARSIGPGLFAGGDAIIQLWLFILAPLIGGALGGFLYPLLFGHGTDPVAGSGLNFARPAPAAVPGYGAPDQYQQEWNQQDRPGPGRVGAGADHPGRLAVGPRRAGVEAPRAVAARHRRPTPPPPSRPRPAPAPTPASAPAPARRSRPPQQPPQPTRHGDHPAAPAGVSRPE